MAISLEFTLTSGVLAAVGGLVLARPYFCGALAESAVRVDVSPLFPVVGLRTTLILPK
jgi:hypothetical protein